MTEDRHLVEAALAAGKARRIPAGVSIGHPDWLALACADPLATKRGVRVFAAFQLNPKKTLSAAEVEKWLSGRGIAATSLYQVDRYARTLQTIRLLEHHGLVEVALRVKGKADRWRLKRADLPRPNITHLKAESQSLRQRNAYKED